MARKRGIFFGLVIPDYVSDGEAHRAMISVANVLENEKHITVENMEHDFGHEDEEPDHIRAQREEGQFNG
jgi:hypothetical protein